MASAATQAKLWYAQRVSAMVLAVCVLVHLATIVYAVRGGLTASEILARTHGNALVASFYALFVVACAVHVPIGVARIVEECLQVHERAALAIATLFAITIIAVGSAAVYAV